MPTSQLDSTENILPAPITYEIQTSTLADGWVNTWTYETSDGDMLPETFTSKQAAQAALEEFLQELAEDVGLGNIADYDREDFRVQAVAATVVPDQEGPRA